jgi:hypothetical protein
MVARPRLSVMGWDCHENARAPGGPKESLRMAPGAPDAPGGASRPAALGPRLRALTAAFSAGSFVLPPAAAADERAARRSTAASSLARRRPSCPRGTRRRREEGASCTGGAGVKGGAQQQGATLRPCPRRGGARASPRGWGTRSRPPQREHGGLPASSDDSGRWRDGRRPGGHLRREPGRLWQDDGGREME